MLSSAINKYRNPSVEYFMCASDITNNFYMQDAVHTRQYPDQTANVDFAFHPSKVDKENGPTMVGDEWNDVELMEYLGASICKELGTNYIEYRTPDPPRTVLNKLELKGYSMVGMAGVGQTCIWTMHKSAKESLDSLPRSVDSRESDSEEKVDK